MKINLRQDLNDRNETTNMDLVGVGVDTIHLHRLAKALKRNSHFFDRLTHSNEHSEWTGYDSLGLAWAGYLWTGKEAVAKALKTGVWREGIDWPDLGVGHTVQSFQSLKDYFIPWHTLLFASKEDAVREKSNGSLTWLEGSVKLLGPALNQRSHLYFRHIFTLVPPSPSQIKDAHQDHLFVDDQTSVDESPSLLENYQALSIVYAWSVEST